MITLTNVGLAQARPNYPWYYTVHGEPHVSYPKIEASYARSSLVLVLRRCNSTIDNVSLCLFFTYSVWM